MNTSLETFRPMQSGLAGAVHSIWKAVLLALGACTLGALSACGGISNLAEEHVAQSDTSVRQAQQTLGQSEHGAVELQRAKEQLEMAKSAMTQGHEKEAEQASEQAHLYAELAIAESQSAIARKSADEVLASLETLRQETERSTPQR